MYFYISWEGKKSKAWSNKTDAVKEIYVMVKLGCERARPE